MYVVVTRLARVVTMLATLESVATLQAVATRLLCYELENQMSQCWHAQSMASLPDWKYMLHPHLQRRMLLVVAAV